MLPYRVDYMLPSNNYYKYRFIDIDCKVYIDKDGDISTAGDISCHALNTGQGANELYAMNQNVRTTDNVSFATVNTGQGATKVYKETYEDISLDSTYPTPEDNRTKTLEAMAIGETKRVYIWNKEFMGKTNTVYLPSEGSYSVSDAIMTGGTACWEHGGSINDKITKYAFIIWRIS
jgi:hypothetical protein